ncbi:hypothetical protein SUGI_0734060 [Cryptomeria japonica]|nr:hypothetical protein SUGI_0734060 [Cryptomeria japonica]
MRCKYLDSKDPKRIFTVANTNKGSTMWNFIWRSRMLITEHLSWQIGNSLKAKFWSDSWGGEISLREKFKDQYKVNEVENTIGDRVVHYFTHRRQMGDRVIWKRIHISCEENYRKLEKILNNRIVFASEEDDNLQWCASKSGDYNVKLGYEVQRNKIRDLKWPSQICWNNKVLPKVGAFLWIAFHGRILIGNKFQSIGISGPSSCVMCKENEKTTNHLLFWCPVASACWEWFFGIVMWQTIRNKEMK